MSTENYYRSVAIENIKGTTLGSGRELSTEEITKLIKTCLKDPSPVGTRDAAIIALTKTCGLRRAEVINLDLSDYNTSTNELKVTGKRNKERMAYIVNETASLIDWWLRLRGNKPGPLFLPYQGYFGLIDCELLHKRMTTQTIYDLLVRRGEQANIEKFSPHDLRRTFVSHLLGAGVDLSTVSKLAGHTSVVTTARYDKRDEVSKKMAIELLHVTL